MNNATASIPIGLRFRFALNINCACVDTFHFVSATRTVIPRQRIEIQYWGVDRQWRKLCIIHCDKCARSDLGQMFTTAWEHTHTDMIPSDGLMDLRLG